MGGIIIDPTHTSFTFLTECNSPFAMPGHWLTVRQEARNLSPARISPAKYGLKMKLKNEIGFGLIIINMICAIFGYFNVARLKEIYLENAKNLTENTAEVLRSDIGASIEGIDLSLQGIIDGYEWQIRNGKINSFFINKLLTEHRQRHSELIALRIVDKFGDTQFGVDESSKSIAINISQRDYFISHKNSRDTGLIITEPVIGKITQKWGIVFSRRLNDIEGNFDGVVYAFIDIKYFVDKFSSLRLGNNGAISLRDLSLKVIARHPISGNNYWTGNTVVSQSFTDAVKSNGDHGTFISGSESIDGISRLVSYKRHKLYPLYIVAGVDINYQLAAWREYRLYAFIFICILFVASGITYRLYMKNIIVRDESRREVTASEQRVKLFFERQNVGMAITSPTKGWLQVNDHLCNMLGYSREELFQTNWADLTFSADLAADVVQFDRLLTGEINQYTLEKRFVRKDGGIVWTELSVGCIRYTDGSVNYVLALLSDITARKRADIALLEANASLQQEVSYRKQLEEEIKERELRFRTLFENATIGIFRTTLEGRFSEMNPALATMLGYDNPAQAMEAITDIANDIYVEPQVRDETISRALAAGEVISAEHLYWGRDGSTWVGHLRLRATTDHEGNIRYLEGCIDDVTERKQIEKIRAEKENELRAIVDASPFPMVISKFPDGNILFVNNAFSDLVGISTDECQNLPISAFYEDLSEHDAIIYKIKNSGRIINKEFGLRKSGGDAIWCLMSAVTFRFNKHDALLICLNDISARKQLEHSLHLANLQAGKALQAERTANQEQRNFLAMVSHEFRMPLAIIQAASRIVSLYTHDPDAQDECDKIIRAVHKMTDLIEVCLSDTRLDTPTVMQNVKEINLYEFIDELCKEKITYYSNLLVINGERDVHINCDLALFEIALSNLIDNAIKYSPKDSPVNVTVGFDAVAAIVRIQDHGVGIGQQDLDRIFEKYFRSTKTDNVQGVGLGLFIVKRIIEMHGGSIMVESELGVGTTFIVSLPAISSPPS